VLLKNSWALPRMKGSCSRLARPPFSPQKGREELSAAKPGNRAVSPEAPKTIPFFGVAFDVDNTSE